MKLYLFAVLILVPTTLTLPVFAADRGLMAEASSLLAAESEESGRAAYVPGHGVMFKPSDEWADR
jgi:hypothetical protein